MNVKFLHLTQEEYVFFSEDLKPESDLLVLYFKGPEPIITSDTSATWLIASIR